MSITFFWKYRAQKLALNTKMWYSSSPEFSLQDLKLWFRWSQISLLQRICKVKYMQRWILLEGYRIQKKTKSLNKSYRPVVLVQYVFWIISSDSVNKRKYYGCKILGLCTNYLLGHHHYCCKEHKDAVLNINLNTLKSHGEMLSSHLPERTLLSEKLVSLLNMLSLRCFLSSILLYYSYV